MKTAATEILERDGAGRPDRDFDDDDDQPTRRPGSDADTDTDTEVARNVRSRIEQIGEEFEEALSPIQDQRLADWTARYPELVGS